jgi:hypothetical protein
MEAKCQWQEEIDKINLDLAKKWDQCEQEEHELKQANAWRQEAQERREARGKEWAQAMKMLDHTNPLIQRQGERLVAKLTEEEEHE